MEKTYFCNISFCQIPLIKVHYQKQRNLTLHLVGYCNLHKLRFLPYEGNLDLEIRDSKKSLKERQQSLFI